jgi:hypothetical protein
MHTLCHGHVVRGVSGAVRQWRSGAVSGAVRRCGTIAFFDLQASERVSEGVSEARLRAAMQCLRHRGPESQGLWLSESGE